MFFCGNYSYRVRKIGLSEGKCGLRAFVNVALTTLLGRRERKLSRLSRPQVTSLRGSRNKHKMNCPSWQSRQDKNPELIVKHKELVTSTMIQSNPDEEITGYYMSEIDEEELRRERPKKPKTDKRRTHQACQVAAHKFVRPLV